MLKVFNWRTFGLLFFLAVVVPSAGTASPTAPAPEDHRPLKITASKLSFTGTFHTKQKVSTCGYPGDHNVVVQPYFKSQLLPGGKIRFSAFNQTGGIHNDHLASVEDEIALLKGVKSVWKKGGYTLEMCFSPGKVVLKEFGDPMEAGFGASSGLAGTYYLKNSAAPQFGR